MSKTIQFFLFFKLSLVGLDAANIPYFRNDHINSKDGSFVQAIHTSGGYYGLKTSYGRVDFFPNGGQKQDPACSPGTDLSKYIARI